MGLDDIVFMIPDDAPPEYPDGGSYNVFGYDGTSTATFKYPDGICVSKREAMHAARWYALRNTPDIEVCVRDAETGMIAASAFGVAETG